MIVFFFLGFMLFVLGIVLLFDLTPERITNDIMKVIFPKQTLKDKVLVAKGKKKSRRITKEIFHIKEALEVTGKGRQFTISCALSLVLLIAGCVLSVLIDNLFLLPVLAFSFALLPFMYAKTTIAYYDKHITDELETALSIISTSYIRSDDIVSSVNENICYLKMPIQGIFLSFLTETIMISSDVKQAIRNLKDKIDNDIFKEWCDTLIACQDDRTLNDTLLPIVAKLTDVRIVNNELKTLLDEVQREYWMMVFLVLGNIPILYMLNYDWFLALILSVPGKVVLGICGVVILITAILMKKYTRPVEYKR